MSLTPMDVVHASTQVDEAKLTMSTGCGEDKIVDIVEKILEQMQVLGRAEGCHADVEFFVDKLDEFLSSCGQSLHLVLQHSHALVKQHANAFVKIGWDVVIKSAYGLPSDGRLLDQVTRTLAALAVLDADLDDTYLWFREETQNFIVVCNASDMKDYERQASSRTLGERSLSTISGDSSDWESNGSCVQWSPCATPSTPRFQDESSSELEAASAPSGHEGYVVDPEPIPLSFNDVAVGMQQDDATLSQQALAYTYGYPDYFTTISAGHESALEYPVVWVPMLFVDPGSSIDLNHVACLAPTPMGAPLDAMHSAAGASVVSLSSERSTRSESCVFADSDCGM